MPATKLNERAFRFALQGWGRRGLHHHRPELLLSGLRRRSTRVEPLAFAMVNTRNGLGGLRLDTAFPHNGWLNVRNAVIHMIPRFAGWEMISEDIRAHVNFPAVSHNDLIARRNLMKQSNINPVCARLVLHGGALTGRNGADDRHLVLHGRG